MKNIICNILLLLPLICFSQQTFDKHYTFTTWTIGNQVLEIPGQGYIVVGVNDSLAFDSLGIPTYDYWSGLILKLDYNGDTIKSFEIGNKDTLFQTLYGKNSDDFFRTAILTDDGNILVGGETQSYNANFLYDYDLWLLKFNLNLDLLSLRTFGIPDSAIGMSTASGNKLHNGGIVLPGFQNYLGFSNSQFHISAFDSSGTLVFHQRILPLLNGQLLGAVETIDSGYMTTGLLYNNIFSSDLSPIVIKTDSVGNVEWYHVLPYSGDMHGAHDITRTNDGNCVYTWANVVYSSGAVNKVWDFHATKIDILGNEIWTKEYGYTFDYYQRIKETPNGNLMMVGWFTDTIGFGKQAYLMLCDANGDSLWTRKISGEPGTSPASMPICYDGTFTSDGGYILTGQTFCCNFTPNFGWTSSLWILKTDSLGLITSVINLPKPDLQHASLSNPYPNPTRDKCTITTLIPPTNENTQGEKGAFLILFDLQGRQLQKVEVDVGLNQTIIDLSTYVSGEYVVALSIDGFNAGTKKIILQK